MQAKYALVFGGLAALLLLTPAAQAQYAYTITALDDAQTDFHPASINNKGQISGYAYVPVWINANSTQYFDHAFYYTNGQLYDVSPYYEGNSYGGAVNDKGDMLIDTGIYNINMHSGDYILGLPGPTLLNDINQNGDVVGYALVNHNNEPFIYHTSTKQIQYLGVPPDAETGAYNAVALNNSGIATGYSVYKNGGHATLFNNSVAQDLGNQPNGGNTQATDINDAGDLIGYSDKDYNGQAGYQAFLYHNGQYINLGTLPGEIDMFAFALSNNGDVVGGTYFHPFLYRNGTLQNLFDLVDPASGWTRGYAVAINDQGWIVGYGNQGGFLMKPTVPPTATISGVITLGGLVSDAPSQSVTVELRPTDGSANIAQTVTVSSDGAYSVSGVLGKSYNVSFKGAKWLRKTLPNVNPDGGNAANVNVTLPAGDANDDNRVDISDFGVLVNAYGGVRTDLDSGYDVRADFACSGMVDLGSFGLLVNNFGLVGDL